MNYYAKKFAETRYWFRQIFFLQRNKNDLIQFISAFILRELQNVSVGVPTNVPFSLERIQFTKCT